MKWYPKNTGNIHDQGLVIDEETGENIAVSYKSEHAPILAAAPEMLAALEKDVRAIEQLCDMVNTYSQKLGLGRKVRVIDFKEHAEQAIRLAKGE